jgi:thioredoxin reductase
MPVYTFENQELLNKFREFAEKFGAHLVSEQVEESEYTPRTKEEILDDFTNVVRDIKSGKALENTMSSEEFFKKYEQYE